MARHPALSSDVGSMRTSSSTHLVSLSTSRVITSMTDSNNPANAASTGSSVTSSPTRVAKSFRLGVPTFSQASRRSAPTPFSTSRRLLITIRRAVSSARQVRQEGVFYAHSAIPAGAHDLRDAKRVVAIGLVWHRSYRCFRLARLNADRHDPRLGQTSMPRSEASGQSARGSPEKQSWRSMWGLMFPIGTRRLTLSMIPVDWYGGARGQVSRMSELWRFV